MLGHYTTPSRYPSGGAHKLTPMDSPRRAVVGLATHKDRLRVASIVVLSNHTLPLSTSAIGRYRRHPSAIASRDLTKPHVRYQPSVANWLFRHTDTLAYNQSGVSETGVEPALPRLKVWCPRPLDDSDK